jgi:hypothetical protein
MKDLGGGLQPTTSLCKLKGVCCDIDLARGKAWRPALCISPSPSS